MELSKCFTPHDPGHFQCGSLSPILVLFPALLALDPHTYIRIVIFEVFENIAKIQTSKWHQVVNGRRNNTVCISSFNLSKLSSHKFEGLLAFYVRLCFWCLAAVIISCAFGDRCNACAICLSAWVKGLSLLKFPEYSILSVWVKGLKWIQICITSISEKIIFPTTRGAKRQWYPSWRY